MWCRLFLIPDLIYTFFFLLAPPVTTMGLVHPEPKTRGELLKCKSMKFNNIKTEYITVSKPTDAPESSLKCILSLQFASNPPWIPTRCIAICSCQMEVVRPHCGLRTWTHQTILNASTSGDRFSAESLWQGALTTGRWSGLARRLDISGEMGGFI